jgi:thymidine kinase
MTTLNYEGSSSVITGPMFSGKTTELMRQLKRHIVATEPCLVITHEKDKRYSEHQVVTHDRVTMDAISIGLLSSIPQEVIEKVKVIGIDEGQFFGDELPIYCQKWANAGKTVIVAALDTTFEMDVPFMNVLLLISRSEKVVKLESVCMSCMKKTGSFSFRKTEEKEVEVIGGTDKYMSLCRQCYLKLRNEQRIRRNSKSADVALVETSSSSSTINKTTITPINPIA